MKRFPPVSQPSWTPFAHERSQTCPFFKGRDETGNDSFSIRWTRHIKSPIAVEQRTAIERRMSGPSGQKMPLQPVHLLPDVITQCYIYLY